MESIDYHSAMAMLAWQVELGCDECTADVPVNRYEIPSLAPKIDQGSEATPVLASEPVFIDPISLGHVAAERAQDLDGLRAALESFEHCELSRGARNLVFADGTPGARVMIIGDPPSREEDREGRPFVGGAGELLDKMLSAIDLSRKSSVYLINVIPWRPPQNRDPKPDEINMIQPFLKRHIDLAKPDVLVVMGNQSCKILLGSHSNMSLRGSWGELFDKPVLPMLHPTYLLRNPTAKRETWDDLLSLKMRLSEI